MNAVRHSRSQRRAQCAEKVRAGAGGRSPSLHATSLGLSVARLLAVSCLGQMMLIVSIPVMLRLPIAALRYCAGMKHPWTTENKWHIAADMQLCNQASTIIIRHRCNTQRWHGLQPATVIRDHIARPDSKAACNLSAGPHSLVCDQEHLTLHRECTYGYLGLVLSPVVLDNHLRVVRSVIRHYSCQL